MSEINIGNIQVNRTLGVGTTNIPLLKGDKGDTGYSISRIERTSGDGTPGTTDTYTIYIDTTPETALATFTVHNGTDGGGDMTKAIYDTNDNGIVDNAEQVNGHTVGIDVPSDAVFTDTVYDDTALSGRVTTLENAGYITKSVADLANYYLKSETYTKQEVNNLCDMIPKFAIEVVSVLPTQDISETTIYLLRDDEETQDVYQEYIYVNNTWERIGGQRIDLSNYYQKNETYSKDELNGKLVNVGAEAPENGERVWFADSKNLLDYNSFVKGRINITTGQIEYANNVSSMTITSNSITYTSTQAWNNGVTSAFIPIEQGDYIYKNKSASLKAGVYIDYYDSSCNFISRYGYKIINANEETSWAVNFTNANAKYIRLHYEMGFADTITLTEVQLQQGTTATSYEPYVEKSINVDDESFISMGDLVSIGINQPSDRKRVWFKKSVNLYNGSQDFSGIWANSDRWATADETYNGLVVKKSSNQWNGLYKEIKLKSGKKYVFSAYVKSDVSRKVAIYLTGGTGSCNPQSVQNIQTTNEWQRISLVFSATNNGLFRPRVENMTDEGAESYTYVCGYQLEEGTTATSYEPYVDKGIYVDNEQWFENPVETFTYTTSNGIIFNFIKYGKIVQLEINGTAAFDANVFYSVTIDESLAPYSNQFRSSQRITESTSASTNAYITILYENGSWVAKIRMQFSSSSATYPRASVTYISK